MSTDEYMVIVGDPVAYKKWYDGGELFPDGLGRRPEH